MLSQSALRMLHRFSFSLLLIIGIVAFVSSSAMAANPVITSIEVGGVTYTSGFNRTIHLPKDPGDSFKLLITVKNTGGSSPAVYNGITASFAEFTSSYDESRVKMVSGDTSSALRNNYDEFFGPGGPSGNYDYVLVEASTDTSWGYNITRVLAIEIDPTESQALNGFDVYVRAAMSSRSSWEESYFTRAPSASSSSYRDCTDLPAFKLHIVFDGPPEPPEPRIKYVKINGQDVAAGGTISLDIEPGDSFSMKIRATNDGGVSPSPYNGVTVSFPGFDTAQDKTRVSMDTSGTTSALEDNFGTYFGYDNGGGPDDYYDYVLAESQLDENWQTDSSYNLTVDITPPEEAFGGDFVIYYRVGMSGEASWENDSWVYDPASSSIKDCSKKPVYKIAVKLPRQAISYEGTIRWYDENERIYKPLRWATVELWDEDSDADDLLGIDYTNADGKFRFDDIQSDDADGPDLYLVIKVESSEAKPRPEFHGSYQAVTDVVENVTSSRSTLISINELGSDVNAACYVLYTVQNVASMFVGIDQGFSDKMPTIAVVVSTGSGGSFQLDHSWSPQEFLDQKIVITKMSWWVPATIAHEYAHAIMSAYYGGMPPHGNCRNHCYNDEKGPGCAIIEGWAEFIQAVYSMDIVAVDWRNTNGTGHILGTCDASINGPISIEDNNWLNLGDENRANVEGIVAGILWDIYDTVSTKDEVDGVYPVTGEFTIASNGVDDDHLSGGLAPIWAVLSEDKPSDIMEFYDAYVEKFPASEEVLSQIYTSHGINMGNTSPLPPYAITPTGGSTVTTLYPTLEWTQFEDGGDGNSQAGFQLRIYEVNGSERIVYDTGLVYDSLSSSQKKRPAGSYSGYDDIAACMRVSESLKWDVHYRWSVRYYDNSMDWSTWSGPATGESDDFYTEAPPNSCPTLAQGTHSPTEAITPEVGVRFLVHYEDADGNAASDAVAVADGSTQLLLHPVLPDSGPPYSALYVSSEERFAIGEHEYHFELSDGECSVRYPESGELYFTVEEGNRAPNGPVLAAPGLGAKDQSRTPLLNWSCTDPDGDPLTYDLYIEKNDDNPRAQYYLNLSDSSYQIDDVERLEKNSHYYWQVRATDGELDTWGPVWDFYTSNENICPTLSDAEICPSNGTPSTDFFFFVKFTDSDGDSPTSRNVIVDDQEYGMHLIQNGLYSSSSEGLQFDVGWHKAYFEFSDGTCSIREPAGQNEFLKFEVKANQCPVLSDGSVDPASGTKETDFTFSVHYSDSEFDAPVTAEVVVDEKAYDLSLESGDAHNGTYESESLTFSDGTHNYYFRFDDGQCGEIQKTQEKSFKVGDGGGGEEPPDGLPFHDTFDSQIDESVWAYVHPPSHHASIASGRLFINARNDWTQGCGVATKDTFPNDTTVQFEVKVTSLGCSNGGQTILQLRDGELDAAYHRPVGPNHVSLYANCDGNFYIKTSTGQNENIGPYSNSMMKQIVFQFTPTQMVVTYEGGTKTFPLVLDDYHIWYGGHIHDAYYDNLSVEVGTDPGQQFCPVLAEPAEDGTAAGGYTFMVHYRDGNGDAPVTKDLYLDGQRFEATLSSGEPSNGTYIYGPVLLDEGTQHEYYFEFDDGQCACIHQAIMRRLLVGDCSSTPAVTGHRAVEWQLKVPSRTTQRCSSK